MKNKKGGRRIRRGRLLLVVALVMAIPVGCLLFLMANPIWFVAHPSVVELGDSYDPRSDIAFVFGSSKDKVDINGELNTNQTGVYELMYALNGRTVKREIHVRDTTGPVLNVHDVQTGIEDEVDAQSFVESSSDLSRYSITIVNPQVLVNRKGARQVILEAKDEYGNTTRKSAKLIRTDETK